MFSPRIQKYFRLRQTVTALAALLFGMLISVLSNWFSEQWVQYLPWLVGATALFLLIWLVVTLRQPAGIDVLIRAPRTARDETENSRYARRGFVGFVPIFTPQSPAVQALNEVERSEAIAGLDFERLRLEDSNLAPTIKAIMTHASRLEHCWLLSTKSKNGSGSLLAARLLVEYLKQVKGLTCQFHYGEELCIIMDEDTEVLQKTYELVRSVFSAAETSKAVKLPTNEIIANITTGVRSMTLGMVLASLDRDRDIEFIGAHYGPDGKPGKDLLPITFSFEPLAD